MSFFMKNSGKSNHSPKNLFNNRAPNKENNRKEPKIIMNNTKLNRKTTFHYGKDV